MELMDCAELLQSFKPLSPIDNTNNSGVPACDAPRGGRGDGRRR
jgi:hypothetical protein